MYGYPWFCSVAAAEGAVPKGRSKSRKERERETLTKKEESQKEGRKVHVLKREQIIGLESTESRGRDKKKKES